MSPPAVPGCRIGRLLGEGTTGTVFEAVNDAGEALAIKFLRETFADDREVVARFVREAKICARLRSEHIAAVVGAGRTEQTYWIIYRRLAGETLAQRLRRDRVLALAALTPIVEQVLRGLAAAHAAGVVHRDIKPANIMLERAGAGERACILDFGVSKDRSHSHSHSHSGASSSGRSLTSHTATLGTINYMPPEQIGASAGVDRRADLYSAGVVAYRAISGQLPYVGSSQAVVLHAKLNEDARPLANATGSRWAESLETFFRRALAREPSARFPDAGAMGRPGRTPCAPRRRWISRAFDSATPTPRTATTPCSTARRVDEQRRGWTLRRAPGARPEGPSQVGIAVGQSDPPGASAASKRGVAPQPVTVASFQ